MSVARAVATEARMAAEKAQQIIQDVAGRVQQVAHDRVAGVVSRCLEAVFDDPYSLKITFDQKRGKTEARLTFVRGELELDPLEESGGGVVDVAAFALRLASLLHARPQRRRLLVLDEPFKHVAINVMPKVGALLLSLAKDLNVQFVIVTHSKHLHVGKVVEVES